MQPIRHISSRTVVLPSTNIDTDQIIPARFLRTTTRDGLGRQLFADWRYDADGALKPEFALNRPEAAGCAVLVAGRNFGCGSSREHAPQAIQKHGFKAVVAENFAEIFFGNCVTLGLPCATATREDIAKIAAAIEQNPATELVLDVAKQEIRFTGQTVKAAVRDSARDALVNGRWDPIGELLDGLPAVQSTASQLPYLAA